MTTDPSDPAYRIPDAEGLTGMDRYARFGERMADAATALELVLDDPFLGAYEPQITALREALHWIEFDTTCGDCKSGRCHWGGDKSRLSEKLRAEGKDYVDPDHGGCGCDRHAESVRAAARDRRWGGTAPTGGGAAQLPEVDSRG